MNTAFFINCIPPKATAQGSSRIMKRRDGSQFVGKSHNSNASNAKRTLIALLNVHRPDEMYIGPVKLSVEWVYPWRKSEPKKNRVDGKRYCDKRPDIDNLCKMLLDAMTTCAYWADDGQVAKLEFTKLWGDHPGILVKIEEL